MRYKVTYIPTYDPEDICKIWVEASSKDEAIREAKSEYWDIKDIISVTKL